MVLHNMFSYLLAGADVIVRSHADKLRVLAGRVHEEHMEIG